MIFGSFPSTDCQLLCLTQVLLAYQSDEEDDDDRLLLHPGGGERRHLVLVEGGRQGLVQPQHVVLVEVARVGLAAHGVMWSESSKITN